MTICRAYPLRGGAGVGILVGEGDYRGGMAVYRKLTWEDMPRIRFAHAHATARYDMAFPAMPRWLEFAYFEQGAVVRRLADGTRQPIPQGSAGLFTFRQASRFYSPAPACRHITVGFEAAYRMEEISREELLAGTRLEEARPPAVFLPAAPSPWRRRAPPPGTLRRADRAVRPAGGRAAAALHGPAVRAARRPDGGDGPRRRAGGGVPFPLRHPLRPPRLPLHRGPPIRKNHDGRPGRRAGHQHQLPQRPV